MSKKSRKIRKKKARLPLSSVVPIVSDGAIATRGTGDGKLIPLLILDTTQRPDLDEWARVHQYLPPGDLYSQWGEVRDYGEPAVALLLKAERPSEFEISIVFKIWSQGILVDQILNAGGVYLQCGKPGDRLSDTLVGALRVLAGVQTSDFKGEWNEIFRREMIVYFRNRGLDKAQARQAAREAVSHFREIGKIRMR